MKRLLEQHGHPLQRFTASMRLLSPAWLLVLTACTTHQVINANAAPARQAVEVNKNLLLDIGIAEFDPGLPANEEQIEKSGIIPDVRRAEARYIAYHLKDTLELTGNWGAVRVTPRDSDAVELILRGEILMSDGERLEARIIATDASGRTWLNRKYSDTASKLSYRNRLKDDPFQDFYNNIANDLLLAREELTNKELTTLRQISAIKFARSMSPYAFTNYIQEERSGKVVLSQLPSDSDKMFARIEKIKEREYLFVDTLDDYYASFYREMQAPYHDWREYTYDEAIELREIQSEARKRGLAAAALIVGGVIAGSKADSYAGQAAALGAAAGGVALAKTAIDKYKESEIHKEALRELSQSLGSELTPIVLDIEGKTIELTGTLDAQYSQWRSILKDIYVEETGLQVN